MKIIKSFKELNKINRRELFKRPKKITPQNKHGSPKLISLDKRYAISIARNLYDGFDDIDLRQEPSLSQYRRARKVINEYYSHIRGKNNIIIRPSKRNRDIYAFKSGMSSKFKIYSITLENKKNKLKVTKRNGKKVIREIGDFIIYDDYYFAIEYPNTYEDEMIKDLGKLGEKLHKRINRIHKSTKAVHISVEGGVHGASLTSPNQTKIELNQWVNSYGADKTFEFVTGLRIATFRNQKTKK